MPVSAGRPTAAPAVGEGHAARLAELWAAEAPAAAAVADLEGLAGHACPQCGGMLYWSGAHTVLLCPSTDHADGRALRMPSPEAYAREAEYAAGRAGRAAVDGLTVGLVRAERDQLARAAHLERRELGRQIAALLGYRRFTAEALDILDWYRAEVDATAGRPPAEALARLEQLAADLADEELPRRGLFSAAVTPADLIGELLEDQADDDEYPDALEASEDQADAVTARQLPASGAAVTDMRTRRYIPPDPYWRQTMPAETVAYWDSLK